LFFRTTHPDAHLQHPGSPYSKDFSKSTTSPSLNRQASRQDSSYFGNADPSGLQSSSSVSPGHTNTSLGTPSSHPGLHSASSVDEFGTRFEHKPSREKLNDADSRRPQPIKQSTYPSSGTRSPDPLPPRRQSQDDHLDGRPLSQQFPTPPSAPANLDPVASLKRRSINPGLTLNDSALKTGTSTSISSPTLSPMSAHFTQRPIPRSPSPRGVGRESPMSSGFHSSSASIVRANSNSSSFDDHGQSSARPISTEASRDNSVSSRPPLRQTPTSDQIISTKIATARTPGESSDSAPISAPPTIKHHPPIDDPPDSIANQQGYRSPSREEVPRSAESTDSEVDDMAASSTLPKDHTDPDIRVNRSLDAEDQRIDDLSDSESPVETTSHSTFIAPALPPIRFSLNTDNFAQLFDSVSTVCVHDLPRHLVNLQQKASEDSPLTPPPSAKSYSTAVSEDTANGSIVTVLNPDKTLPSPEAAKKTADR
jgi:Rho-type GTPase-activating protein 1/2